MQADALQQHDEWDATPLYYAAYSGNKELVKFLLSVGAKCEENVVNCFAFKPDPVSFGRSIHVQALYTCDCK